MVEANLRRKSGFTAQPSGTPELRLGESTSVIRQYIDLPGSRRFSCRIMHGSSLSSNARAHDVRPRWESDADWPPSRAPPSNGVDCMSSAGPATSRRLGWVRADWARPCGTRCRTRLHGGGGGLAGSKVGRALRHSRRRSLNSTFRDGDIAHAGISGWARFSLFAAHRIQTLAQAVARGYVRFDPTVTFDEMVSSLTRAADLNLASAHRVAMRALGEPYASPFGAPSVLTEATE